MSVMNTQVSDVQSAIGHVCRSIEHLNKKESHWWHLREDSLWRELVACILGSRVSFETTHAAVERLARARLFSKEKRSSHFDKYEMEIEFVLLGRAAHLDVCQKERSYPFPRLRATQIRQSAENLYGRGSTLRRVLEEATDVRQARQRLVAEISGIGPKQASLFLRNIGYANELAVLDVHVLTYMTWVGLIPKSIRTVRTLAQYENLENVFLRHVYSTGHSAASFDQAVWVVVRLLRKEGRAWVS